MGAVQKAQSCCETCIPLLDLRGNIPVFVDITDGKVHDVNTLDLIDFEPGAIYVMDKAYTDFARLFDIERHQAYFVIRGKRQSAFRHVNSTRVTNQLV
jgi:transposase